ncbi:MAG: adenosylcobinamide-GDP ribazoletransferase [Anaerolineae bacterium]|jgi:adenosylcobinamide-GDP ribazoletransferase|nr:adenosylcobinamide-GDP ribazoletransferase [Anaerolineae bacterium]
MGDLLRALGLLTTLPVRPRWDETVKPGRAMAWYPLAGLIVGGLTAAVAFALAWLGLAERAALLAAALVLAAWAALTGALHLDGWADCCDALFVPAEREKRLAIMKDPRLGSFGAVGLALLLLVKLAALQPLLEGRATALVGLPLAACLARALVVVAAWRAPLAKQDGMAFYMRQSLGGREVAITALTAVAALAAAAFVLGLAVLAALAAALLAALAVAALARARLGGLTGDVYGAIIEASETAALVALIIVGV